MVRLLELIERLIVRRRRFALLAIAAIVLSGCSDPNRWKAGQPVKPEVKPAAICTATEADYWESIAKRVESSKGIDTDMVRDWVMQLTDLRDLPKGSLDKLDAAVPGIKKDRVAISDGNRADIAAKIRGLK